MAWRGAPVGWRTGWPGAWGWGAAAIGAGIAASSYYYPYGYYPYNYPYGGYGGCGLQHRLVWTNWGYRQILVRVCY
jgi:hypothetical protein